MDAMEESRQLRSRSSQPIIKIQVYCCIVVVAILQKPNMKGNNDDDTKVYKIIVVFYMVAVGWRFGKCKVFPYTKIY
jgi:hypothetical protein